MFIFFKLTLSRMKKVIMAVGLLLVAAVFMSGCVTEAEDRLLGLWMSDEPSKEAEGTFDIVILLRPDGTGVEIWTLPGSHVASAKYYFDWEMTSSTTYQAVYDDGEVWDFAADGLGLTDGGVTYSKVGYDVLAEYAKKVTA